MLFVPAGRALLIAVTADQLNGFPILLLAVGALLLAAEIFLIPGFGVAGIAGLAALGAGFVILAANVTFGDPGDLGTPDVLDFTFQFALTLLAGVAVIVLIARALPGFGFGRRMVLQPAAGTPTAAVPVAALPRTGERGSALSALRPAGTADFGGVLVDVVSDSGYVEAGATIVVVAVEGQVVSVRPAPRAQPSAGAGVPEARS